MGKGHLLFIALAAACSVASSAMAATFTAKAEGNTITIYATSEKPEHCSAGVKFTYLSNGKRTDGWTKQPVLVTKPGKNVEQFHFTDPLIIAPLIDGDVISECKD